jgi:metal-dependent hydrolase (beta-lactamase superfamily II)
VIQRILFDTGQRQVLAHNQLSALGIDVARAIAKFMEVPDAHLADGSNR